MFHNVKRDLSSAVVAVVLGAILYFIVPDNWSIPAKTALGAAVAIALFVAFLVTVKILPLLARRTASMLVRFMVYGLKQWARENAEIVGRDNLWNWITDQLLVAQSRYAFSVSCIAFSCGDNNKQLRCLLIRREFERFGNQQIYMWPGGRFRGSSGSIERELRSLVHAETGCNVDLLPLPGSLVKNGFSEAIATYNLTTDKSDLENELIGSPLLIMQQNRPQRHDVPGHVDLIYLARVRDGATTSGDASLISLDDLDSIDPRQLWADTKECIRRAAVEFNRIVVTSDPKGAS